MHTRWRIAAIAALSLLAGLGGALLSRQWQPLAVTQPSLHDRLHGELDLTAVQDNRIHALEREFSTERARHEAAIRAANRRLAGAMADEGRYGPAVASAVDDIHAAMGELQKASLEHVFAMRRELDAGQRTRFDAIVSESLTAPAQ
ncbi:MAG: hypothetical protein B7Y35_14005 [Sphingomonadales bacterium 28-64-96]|nr:MAG: hypothetical protein B7Y35_14005 [Sphingomonadales bacterium 28-64-96]